MKLFFFIAVTVAVEYFVLHAFQYQIDGMVGLTGLWVYLGMGFWSYYRAKYAIKLCGADNASIAFGTVMLLVMIYCALIAIFTGLVAISIHANAFFITDNRFVVYAYNGLWDNYYDVMLALTLAEFCCLWSKGDAFRGRYDYFIRRIFGVQNSASLPRVSEA